MPEPRNRFERIPCSGVLNEYLTPLAVGGSGLTACENLIYHRQNAWGKRCGSVSTLLPHGPTTTPVSGFRWYRAFPSPLTKLLVYAQQKLSIGNSPSSLSVIGTHALSGADAPMFCAANDPQAGTAGADVVIIAGLVLPNGSFSTGNITITGLPDTQPTAGTNITIVLSDGVNTVTVPSYYILGTDNPASIAAQLVDLINASAAFLNPSATPPFPAFLGEAYSVASTPPVGALNPAGHGQAACPLPTATIYLGARKGGAAGNSYTYTVTLNHTSGGDGTPLKIATANNAAVTNGTLSDTMGGGGNTWSGLARYDNADGILVGLSYMAPNAFTGVTFWHDHVWAWGDPNNPDDLFACDILQPESWTFMIENGPVTGPSVGKMTGPNNGGYHIGKGDGDPVVQNCIPIGNALYVFKTSHIYMIEGYDFQQGEYQFSVTPQVEDYGIPAPDCVDVLENELVFWSGRQMMRLAVGSYEPEHIGKPIPYTEGNFSKRNQDIMRVVAGNFQVQAMLTNQYGMPQPFASSTLIYRSMMLVAGSHGGSNAQIIAVYDDEASNDKGQYAWSIWDGWEVGCWILQGNGPAVGGGDVDNPYLYFIDPDGIAIHRVGADPSFDDGVAVPWMAQTGWVDYGTPEVIKNAQQLFLNAETTDGANFTATLAPGRIVDPAPNWDSTFGTTPQTIAFQPTLAPTGDEANNDMSQYAANPNGNGIVPTPIQAQAIMYQFNEDGTSGAGLELLSYGLDIRPEEAEAT